MTDSLRLLMIISRLCDDTNIIVSDDNCSYTVVRGGAPNITPLLSDYYEGLVSATLKDATAISVSNLSVISHEDNNKSLTTTPLCCFPLHPLIQIQKV